MIEALRLAHLLCEKPDATGNCKKAAAELRRLAAESEMRRLALQDEMQKNKRLTEELEALKRAISDAEPVGFMNEGHIHELLQKRIPYGYVYQRGGTGAETPLYTLKGIK